MARHVAERAGAKVKPAAPIPSVIHILLVGAFFRWSEPVVPTQRGRHDVRSFGAHDALWPDGTIRPDMDLAHRADDAGLDHFDRAAQTIMRAALIAHLRGDFVFAGEVAQITRLMHRLRERLLTINVFAKFDRRRGNQCVHVIGRRNDHGINVLFLVEQLTPVAVKFCIRIFCALAGGLRLVNVAQRNDVVGVATIRVTRAFAGRTDAGDVQLVVGGNLACARGRTIAGEGKTARSEGGGVDKLAARKAGVSRG